ncbi:ATP-binding protein [Moritella sp. Urea-trap-13]|uniref:ATP-binding protein n=1 Tax=Moritella sp. Urea-trap-13 TaxID=2058327 RepID=UPI000C34FB0C|nr:ATP-binding protein [Moritella sp. Urea-trap-13]PKH08129.1 hybrid sensor histidine kinase/response regulator [Moritella sp. Urea-trap-13]
MDLERQIVLLKQKVAREKACRKSAEQLLEDKSNELFLAKKMVEDTLVHVQQKAEQDMAFLTFKIYLDSILLDFSQLFLKNSISDTLLQRLLNHISHVDSISAVQLKIQSINVADKITVLNAGGWTQWQESAEQTSSCRWSSDHRQLHIIIDGEESKLGVFSVALETKKEWQHTIEKQLSLFSEVISVAYQRKYLLDRTILEMHRAENSEKSTRDFVAMINHELRTPLNGLLGSADLMADTKIDTQQARLLTTIHQSGELLRVIINDLLDFSKMSAGMLELLIKPFEVVSVSRVIDDIFSIRAEDKGLQFELFFSEQIPLELLGDAERIKQILVNLIGNALKFTSEGKVSVYFLWENEQLVFNIVDTGCGISLDKQSNLFEPFVQVDNSSNRKHEGTGLGLSICLHLIQEMQGELILTSELDKGSEFKVCLPLAIPAKNMQTTQVEEEIDYPIHELTLLVVEDIKMNQVVIEMMLKKLGLNCDIKNNGEEALRYLEQHNVDIILMDCRMPIMDGFEATRILRQQGYTKPIIALTAGTTNIECEECLACGMDAIVNKPYQLKDLEKILNHWGKRLSNPL